MRMISWLFILLIVPISAGVIYFFGRSAAKTYSGGAPQETIQQTNEIIPQEQPLITFIDPSKGDRNAENIIVEYGNHSCPFCRRAEEDIDKLMRTHPDKVRFVWKDVPSTLYAGSDVAAEAAFCAKDQGKFWEYHKELFRSSSLFNQTSLSLAANALGLDITEFSNCLSEGKKKTIVQRNISEAEALQIDGTPYFFINGERYSGQLSYEELKEATNLQ